MPGREDGMRPLLLISQDQFGYLTDTLKYCRYLRSDFRITYVGWDYGLPPVPCEGITCIHLSRRGTKLRRYASFLWHALRIVRQHPPDGIVFVEYFALCAFLVVFGGRRSGTVVDIRTGYVRSGGIVRTLVNGLLTFDTLFFRHVTVISDSLRRFLHLSARRSHVVPLGADAMHLADKYFATLRLFYVGSLDHRHIDETVRGLDMFLARHPDAPVEGYDIVGFGSPEVEEGLRAAMRDARHARNIVFHGRIPNTMLGPFLERCNVRRCLHPRGHALPGPAGDQGLRVSPCRDGGYSYTDVRKCTGDRRLQRGSER